jgi:hypothetical protein
MRGDPLAEQMSLQAEGRELTCVDARCSILTMPRTFGAALVVATILFRWGAGPRAEGNWAPADTVITMVRGGCEKRCPVYRVVVFADGTVIVEGRYYLRKPVFARSEIPTSDVKTLVDRFLAIDYLHLRDDFGFKGKGCASFAPGDAPSVTTTLVTGGQGKSIVHYQGCLGEIPKRITELERAIDETAHTDRWLKDALRGGLR